jgi:hypothetical protein
MKHNNTAKFTFDYTWKDVEGNLVSRTRHTTTDETLGEILDTFELFLKGAGFYFDGSLEFVNQDTGESTQVNYADHNKPPMNGKQMEFDFVKELFTDFENLDDTDLDQDDEKIS